MNPDVPAIMVPVVPTTRGSMSSCAHAPVGILNAATATTTREKRIRSIQTDWGSSRPRVPS